MKLKPACSISVQFWLKHKTQWVIPKWVIQKGMKRQMLIPKLKGQNMKSSHMILIFK